MREKTNKSQSALHSEDDQFEGRLFDPQDGSEPFHVQSRSVRPGTFEPDRTNYFTVIWIEKGAGQYSADTARHEFHAGQLLFFVPYQYLRFDLAKSLKATIIHFHANFLCVETFHAETGCSGLLFKDLYGSPAVTLDETAFADVAPLIERMEHEFQEQQLGHRDAILACLKLLLIIATRLKTAGSESAGAAGGDFRHPQIGPLRDLIEKHYRELHAPADYAELLHVTPKTLGRLVRDHLGKTLSDLIRERILMHAKWELLHTLKPVKEVAAEVGFQDELYFSRLFKKATGMSPRHFREFETRIRGGSNLSMFLSH